MDHQELARLVEQAQAGSVEAFAKIYNEVSKSLYYYALKITKNEHDAKDVVQETMIEVYKHLGELRNPGALKAYVNSAGYRCSLNLLNKNKKHQNDDIDEMLDLTDDEDEFLPEGYAENQERREYIIRLVDDLPEAQRTVVMLFYYKQLSSKEIADMLGIEDGAVRARLNRARATLRQMLERDGNGRRENAITLLAIPVLTQVFNMDANIVFIQSIGKAIWESMGAQLGFSAASIAATSMSASLSAGSSTAAAATTTVATTAVGASATVAAGFSVPLIAAAAVSVAATITLSAGVAFSESNLVKAILPDPTPLVIMSYSGQAGPEIPVSIELEPEEESPATKPEDRDPAPENRADEQPGRDSGAGEDASHQDAAESGAASPGDVSGATITVTQEMLSYPAGTAVDVDQIMKDTGAAAFDDKGNSVDITVLGYEDIDFSSPDDYYVYFEIKNSDGQKVWKAIIILVE